MTMTEAPQASDYAPYHTFEAFDQGYTDYMNRDSYRNGHGFTGVDEQAYDRGAEYAMRIERWHRNSPDNMD
jgi:hypothetical protein